MDWARFIEMGGYGAYVWPAYGLVALSLLVLLGFTLRRLHKALHLPGRRKVMR